MSIKVELESLTNKARFVNNSYLDEQGQPNLVSSELPLPTADIIALRTFEGRTYSIGVAKLFNDKLAANASLDLAVAWAQDVEPRITITGICGGDSEAYLYEGATVSGGTAITASNLRRNSTRESQSAALVQPTVTDTGTLLIQQILPGGVGKRAGGGGGTTGRLYLKPLTTYLFRITNRDPNNTAHAAEIILEWYE
jgi:hypothetical protein